MSFFVKCLFMSFAHDKNSFDFTDFPERVSRTPGVPGPHFDNCHSKESMPFIGNRFSKGLRYCAAALAFYLIFLVFLKPEEVKWSINHSLASLKPANQIVLF